MSNVPQENPGISDSWVDLSGQIGTCTPPLIAGTITPPFTTTATLSRRVTPVPFGGEYDYLRMLREAQRESNRSSTKVSPITSAIMSLSTTPKRTTPSSSPKSPPNSPNCEVATFTEELRGVYVNRIKTEPAAIHGNYSGTNSGNGVGSSSPILFHSGNGVTASDIVWDWSSRPNIPKDWKSSSNICKSRKSSESSKSSKISGKTNKKAIISKEVLYTLVITNLISFLIGTGIGIWLRRGVDQCGCCGDVIDIAI